ncbi:MAG: carbon-nitrogen hydrolase family protein [Alphaproteobacteria bacterium]|nr:carbon-nitrogen hydrolase family protein [Alphaproteobacteria bacterium]
MGFKIAVVQPMVHQPPDDEKNVADAVEYVKQAAHQGAAFVAFPESYPGPWRMPATFNPIEQMAEAAAKYGVHIQFGTLQPINDAEATAHNLLMLAYPDGRDPGAYKRTHPPGPWIYTGGGYWEFQYVPGDEFPVFDTIHGRVGLAMCSEVYVPEVSRALALRGAEIIFLPGGVDKQKLWATWRNLIWSRSIENLAIAVSTQNLFSAEERGLAMVATPEEVLFESTTAGLYVVDVDLDRVRDLRSQNDEVMSAHHNAAKAGVLTQWQRPELYDSFHPRAAIDELPETGTGDD